MLFISYAAFKFIQYFKVIKYCFKEIEKQKFGTQFNSSNLACRI